MMDAALRPRRAHIAVGLLLAALSLLANGRLAYAHTDFDSSTPTNGAVVVAPLAEVVLNFTNPAQPAGDGFELLDPTGSIRTPSAVDETDGTSFRLTFDPPLTAGTYGLRWQVQAGDAHPINGSFHFEVTESAPNTPDPGAAPSSSVVASPPMSHTDMEMDMDAAAHASMSEGSMTDGALHDFLTTGADTSDATAVGRVGRTMTILGATFGIGVLAALVWTIRGRREELETQLGWVRLAGLVLFTGGLIELAALTDIDPSSSLTALLATKPGLATALKMLGGIAVMIGFHQRAGRIIAPMHSLSAAVATDLPPALHSEAGRSTRSIEHGHRWSPTASAAFGLAGFAAVLVSFWFDGHTVSRGPWVIHSAVNLVHLGAAAVWGGGVFAMTTVAWMRHRRAERTDLAAMVVRFSSTATVALAAVVVAGLLMTWMILDSPGDLFGTRWGQVLIAKVAVVSVAAGLGAYNHFRLRPRLEQRPDDATLAKALRTTLTVESVAFMVVIVLTAVLVAAAT
jgi:copper transport protein